MGKNALLQAHDKDATKLQLLGGMDRHEPNAVRVIIFLILSCRGEAGLEQKLRQISSARGRLPLLKSFNNSRQLHQMGDTPHGITTTFHKVALIPGSIENGLNQSADRTILCSEGFN